MMKVIFIIQFMCVSSRFVCSYTHGKDDFSTLYSPCITVNNHFRTEFVKINCNLSSSVYLGFSHYKPIWRKGPNEIYELAVTPTKIFSCMNFMYTHAQRTYIVIGMYRSLQIRLSKCLLHEKSGEVD